MAYDDPYSFYGMGSANDPFNYSSVVDYPTNFATPVSYDDTRVYDPTREAYDRRQPPRNQVPGTYGSPQYTPSATPGGVSGGSGTGMPSQEPNAPYNGPAIANSPYGSLAALLSPGSSNPNMKNALSLGSTGLKMMAPPQQQMPVPQAPGGPAQLGRRLPQNPQEAQLQQIQQMYGVSRETAMALMQMQPGAYGGGNAYGGGYPQMAYGGRPTGPTIVGERGPEMFVPDMPGTIVPMQGRPQMPPMMGRQINPALRNAAIHAALARRRF